MAQPVVKFELENHKHAGLALTAAAKYLPDTGMQKALAAGARVVRKAAVSNAPVGRREYPRGEDGAPVRPYDYHYRKATRGRTPGTLRKAIIVKHARDYDTWVYFVGVTSGPRAQADAFYARYLELGTVHSPPRPWLGPAFSQSTGAAIAVIGEIVAERTGLFQREWSRKGRRR